MHDARVVNRDVERLEGVDRELNQFFTVCRITYIADERYNIAGKAFTKALRRNIPENQFSARIRKLLCSRRAETSRGARDQYRFTRKTHDIAFANRFWDVSTLIPPSSGMIAPDV